MTVSMHLFLGLGWTAPWVHKGLELQAMLALVDVEHISGTL